MNGRAVRRLLTSASAIWTPPPPPHSPKIIHQRPESKTAAPKKQLVPKAAYGDTGFRDYLNPGRVSNSTRGGY